MKNNRKKSNISDNYILFLKLLDDDDIFIKFYYCFPFEFLEIFVPKYYLLKRYEYLKKKGLIKYE